MNYFYQIKYAKIYWNMYLSYLNIILDIFIFINSILISLGIPGIPDYIPGIPGILEDIKNNIPLITGSLLVATFIWRCCIKPEKIVNLAYSKVIKKEERGSIKGVEKLWLGIYDKNDKTNSFLRSVYGGISEVINITAYPFFGGLAQKMILNLRYSSDTSDFTFLARYVGFAQFSWWKPTVSPIWYTLGHVSRDSWNTYIFPAPNVYIWKAHYYNPFYTLRVVTRNSQVVLTPSSIIVRQSDLKKFITIDSYEAQDLYRTTDENF